jgi:formate dehydrogenase major subunit
MADQRRHRTVDVDDVQLRVGAPEDHAAGLKAITVSAKRRRERAGPARTARTWLKLNQADGFDCMSCAWPDPDPKHRHTAEFCENGAKAVVEEATMRRATPQFFAERSIAELDGHSEYLLGQQAALPNP